MAMVVTNIGRLVTMEPSKGRDGELGIVKNAAVVIENERVKWVGHGSEAKILPGYKVINAKNMAVIPGLVDCHTHLVHGGSRIAEFAARARGATYEEISRAGGGIMSTVRATRSASAEELFNSAKKRAAEMMAFGITTIEIKSGYGLDVENELKILGVIKKLKKVLPIDIVATFLGAHAFPDKNRTKYVNLIINEMLPRIAREGLAEFCDIFVEKMAFSQAEAERILISAKKLGLKLKLHADQLTRNEASVLASHLKAVSADHLEHVSLKGIKTMAKANVVAVLIPSSTFFIGGKYAPARKLIKNGVKVALSTDYNPGTSPILNLWLAAAMAITQMKLTPEEAYRGITIHPAHALGLEKTHGSIAVGKFANLAILESENEIEPFYRFDRPFVHTVISRGKIVSEKSSLP